MSGRHSGSVSMASTLVLVLSIVPVLIGSRAGCAASFTTMLCTPEINGQHGQASVLSCKINISGEVENPEIVWLSWTRSEGEGRLKTLLRYHEENLTVEPGYSLAREASRQSLDVSLVIANTTVQHQGEYKCEVLLNCGRASDHSTLSVTANYSKPTFTNATSPSGPHLECCTSRGYPRGQIRWFVGGNKDITENATMDEKQTDGGLFELSSCLHLQISTNYTCAVFNANGDREQENTFQYPPETEGPQKSIGTDQLGIKIAAPLVVIGSIIVALLLLLLVMKWRRRYHHPQDETYEAGCPDLFADDEAPRGA